MRNITSILKLIFILTVCIGCYLLNFTNMFNIQADSNISTPAPTASPNNKQNLLQETNQVVFIIDDSSSMVELALDPQHPNATRWDVVKQVYPQWVDRLGKDTLVGSRSVGGSCEGSPIVNFPVGTDKVTLVNFVNGMQPNGATNLNAALQATPALFDLTIRGSKHIIILSDGMNTCSPIGSTCDIVRDLYVKYGITTDIVAWITDPATRDEFKCAVDSTGGTLSTPVTIEEWANVPLPNINLWRYVVFVLGLVTLFFATLVFYRHSYHVSGWSPVQSSLSAGILLTISSLILYGVLFIGYGIITTLFGAATFIVVLVLVSKSQVNSYAQSGRPSWPTVGLLLAALLFPINVFAEGATDTMSKAVKSGPPQYHHILVLDASGSVLQHLDEMKALLSNYASLYTRPKESITLILFAYDEAGSVKELRTFTIPPDGSTTILDNLLDDIEIQDPGKTNTYFKPMAEFLKQFLQKVRLEPIILVVSDGVSDAERNNVGFKDIPFESLGKRGIYKVPGIKNWRVAIDGGRGIDFGPLFKDQKPFIAQGKKIKKGQSPVSTTIIDPCLIEPELIVETQEQLTLVPSINPFSTKVHGTLQAKISNYCVERFRSFTINLRKDSEVIPVGKVENHLITTNTTDFSFEVSLDASQSSVDSVVEITLEQSGITKTVYPTKPAKIKIEQLSYLGAYWLKGSVVLLATVGLLTFAFFGLSQYQQKKKAAPEYIKIQGGKAVPLYPQSSVSIGGQNCDLAILGVLDSKTLAVVESTGKKGELRLRPNNGVRLKIGGVDYAGVNTCSLGQSFELVDGDQTYQITLMAAKQSEVSLGDDIISTKAGISGFDDINFSATSNNVGINSKGNNINNSNADII